MNSFKKLKQKIVSIQHRFQHSTMQPFNPHTTRLQCTMNVAMHTIDLRYHQLDHLRVPSSNPLYWCAHVQSGVEWHDYKKELQAVANPNDKEREKRGKEERQCVFSPYQQSTTIYRAFNPTQFVFSLECRQECIPVLTPARVADPLHMACFKLLLAVCRISLEVLKKSIRVVYRISNSGSGIGSAAG